MKIWVCFSRTQDAQRQSKLSGGWCYDNNDRDGRRSLVANVDAYDVANDVWSVETQIPKPKFHAGVAIVRNKVTIVKKPFFFVATTNKLKGLYFPNGTNCKLRGYIQIWAQ